MVLDGIRRTMTKHSLASHGLRERPQGRGIISRGWSKGATSPGQCQERTRPPRRVLRDGESRRVSADVGAADPAAQELVWTGPNVHENASHAGDGRSFLDSSRTASLHGFIFSLYHFHTFMKFYPHLFTLFD